MMRFSCNFKWWWALWLWDFEAFIVNEYMMYNCYQGENDLSVEYNHYEFVGSVVTAQIDPIN